MPISIRHLLAFAGLSVGITVSAQIAPRITHQTVEGAEVYVLRTGAHDIVTLAGSLPAGDAASAHGGNPAVATLVGEMLDQGTERHDKFAIAQQLEAVGANLDFSVDNDFLKISGRCLRKDLPLLLSLLMEQLREPALSPEDLERTKLRLIGNLQRAMEDTSALAHEAFNNAIYPRDHPNFAVPYREFIAATNRVNIDEVRAFHHDHYGSHGLVLVLVGDVDSIDAIPSLEPSLQGWAGGSEIQRATAPAPTTSDQALVRKVDVPDKTSVDIVWGQATGLRFDAPDALPLSVGTAILGEGFTGRLLANVRDRAGLTYGIGASLANDDLNDGDWRISATFAPELLEQGIAATRHELETWWQDGVTAKELVDRKSNLAGTHKLRLATTRGIARAILLAVQRGEPLDSIDTYPARVQQVTLDQVNTAIKTHLNPKQMTLVEAGTLP